MHWIDHIANPCYSNVVKIGNILYTYYFNVVKTVNRLYSAVSVKSKYSSDFAESSEHLAKLDFVDP